MGSGRLRGALIGTALLLLGLLPAAASADVGPPIDLGPGQNVNVSLEADGTANIAYTGQGSNSTELDYCKLPRGATQCSVKSTIPAPGDSLTIPLAIGSGNTVNVISYRYGLTPPFTSFSQVLLFTSGDSGNTWSAPTPIGTIPPFDIRFGPGGLISAVTDAVTAELDYQAWSLTSNTSAKAVLDGDPYEYQGRIGFIDANTPIVVYASRGGDGRFRRFSGVGDVNDQANWAPSVELGKLGTPHVVSGPNGVILLAQNDLTGADLEARRFDGSNFGSRQSVEKGQSASDAVQDAGGRVHVIGYKYGGKNGQFWYGSSYDGSRWITEAVDYPTLPLNTRLAVNADHFGTVVGTLYDGGHVFAASIGPAAAEPKTGKFVGASLVSGQATIQIPPSKTFVPLNPGDVVPVGSVVDATKGRVRITIKLPNGKLQSTDFYSGIFKVTQAKSGLATMVLAGSLKAARSVAMAAKGKKKVLRQLWASGSGRFATKGRFAAATIRGTTWLTIDRADATVIRVTAGKIAVRDFKKKRTVVIGKGKTYTAKR